MLLWLWNYEWRISLISIDIPSLSSKISIEITWIIQWIATKPRRRRADNVRVWWPDISPGTDQERIQGGKVSREVCQKSGVTIWPSIKWLSQKWKIDGSDLGNPTWYIGYHGYHLLEWAIWLCPKWKIAQNGPIWNSLNVKNDYQQWDGMQYPTFQTNPNGGGSIVLTSSCSDQIGVFPPTIGWFRFCSGLNVLRQWLAQW